MLQQILDFKLDLKKELDEGIPNIYEFINCIKIVNNTYNLDFVSCDSSHWRNYIHAALISLYLELTTYDLIQWNEYISKKKIISTIFNFSKSGEDKIFELFVLHSINKVFDFEGSSFDILALKSNNNSNPKYLTDDSNENDVLKSEDNLKLLSNLKITMKVRGMPKKEIWGDNDIIVTLKNNGNIQQFCIISCKTSLRERVYQSVFWSMHSRLEGIGKHIFITIDKGNREYSEIGNRKADNSAKKTRDVLESTMDRVYVLRNKTEVNRSQIIKDFSWLKNDLIIWANEITGNLKI